jgi:hypothetical protein
MITISQKAREMPKKNDPYSMDLPLGETCSGCAHHPRCIMLFGCKAANTRCDWAPSRYLKKPELLASPTIHDIAAS